MPKQYSRVKEIFLGKGPDNFEGPVISSLGATDYSCKYKKEVKLQTESSRVYTFLNFIG